MESIKNKRILLVITKSNWGGAQSYVYRLAEYFSKQGAHVSVALGGTGEIGAEVGLLAARLREASIPVHVLTSFSRDVSLFHDLSSLSELRRIIRAEHPDIIHLNSSKAGGIGALAARLEGIPRILFTAHGWAHREPRPFHKKLLVRISSWMTILFTHAVIVVSKLDYDDAPVLFSRKKIFLIRNGIAPFELLNRADARAALSEKAGTLNEDGIWLCMLAELTPNKGIDIAIRALKEVVPAHPDTTLVVMGEGEERAKLEKSVAELNLQNHVRFLGFVEHSRAYLKAADLFLLPSRKEGLPFVLLEAGIAELPVIASSVGGIPEVIESGINGLLINSNDASQLADSVLELLDTPEEAREFAQKLHTKIEKSFSEKEMLEQTTSLYLS